MKLPLPNPLSYRRLDVSMRVCDDSPPVALSKPECVAAFAHGLLDCPQEVMLWIGVDCRKHVVAVSELFRGTADACLVHPRDVFRNALVMAPTVAGVFLVHNHPSGSIEPSSEDLRFYEQVTAAGQLLRVPVVDCLVVAEEGFWSKEIGRVERSVNYAAMLPDPSEGEQPWAALA